ncbi:M23 family metallopeptidase [Sphingomonas parva]|uniref:M23 family metallopeptidase n=1 Tax=Sphingomonas parva TaxID=2555898 RepID=A0A4Y8ZNN2_9SPHN|nr:M23 family metallopeptidase [Sphingomonas parva]TFI57620.1 M23 family metallopeptidase [Sphingomonas parva]
MRSEFVDSYDPRRWMAAWTPSPGAPASFRRHAPRRLAGFAAALGVLLAGAATAWLAAPEAPLPATTPPIADGGPDAPPAQAATPGQIRRTITLSRADDLAAALASSGLDAALAAEIARAAAPGLSPAGEIRASLTLVPIAGGGVQLARLEASNRDSSGVVVTRADTGALTVARVAPQLRRRTMVHAGTMDGDSFYTSAVAVGVPNSVIPVFAKALAFDFDFQREVAAGDAFEIAYEQEVNAVGERFGAPNLVYASLTTAAKSAAVYRFAPDGGEGEWFDASGRSIVRALMRTPVDGARVSSKFGYRLHPILGFRKLHGGIDFAAPTGTPIYASGNGVVDFAGPKGANGNFIRLHHDNGWYTLYLHLNRFAPGITAGTRVAQGQQIGEVGTTGRSTGPHLHYEVHIDGEKVDPLSIKTESGRTLSGSQLIAFERVRDRIDVSRAAGSD